MPSACWAPPVLPPTSCPTPSNLGFSLPSLCKGGMVPATDLEGNAWQ